MQFCETQNQFNIQKVYSYIETLSTSTTNLTWINPPDLQFLLFDIKNQLRSHPQLDLPANITSDIWRYYKFLKIQAFVLTYALFVILTIPLLHKCLTFHLYRIHNIPLAHPILKKSLQCEIEHRYFAIRSDLH